jgi:vacuolar-type H+-ATPase subunit I/STV1
VSEAQKDQLLAMTVPKRPILWQIALWSTLCLMVALAGIVVWAYTRHQNPTLIDTISMMVLTFVQVVVALLILRWRKRRALRPLLASLPTTDLRITRSDLQRQTMNTMSVRQLVLLGAINVMACSSFLIGGIIFLILGQPQGFFYLAGALLFGTLAIVHYRRLIDRVGNTPVKAVTSP